MVTPAYRANQKDPYLVAQDSDIDMSYHSLMYEDGTPVPQWQQQQWQQQQQQQQYQNGEYQSTQQFYGPGVPNWPEGPARLRRSNMFATCAILIDGVLIIVALLFLVLAIAAVSVRDRPTGDGLGTLIEQAMKLGPTVFPITFAALVGRSLKNIGRYRAEKGVHVSALWPLMYTKTIFDAVVSQWQLGTLSLTAISLALLWALSPLGGQASLRVVYTANLTSSSSLNLIYMDTGAMGNIFAETSNVETYDLGANASGLPTSMQATYDAALMQGVETKLGPRDAWGNPKIPRLDLFDQSNADSDGWIDVTDIKSVETYSSLMGMPIIGVPKNGTAEFTIESSYVALGSPAIQYHSRTGGSLGLTVTCPDCVNWAHNYHPVNDTVMQKRQMQLLGPPCPQPNATELQNASYTKANYIRFDQEYVGDTGLALMDVTQKLVETTISCDSGNCKATKMRTLTTDHRPENITGFDWWGTFALDMITAACTRDYSQIVSPTEFFLNASSQIPISHQVLYYGNSAVVNFSTIDAHDLSNRAAALLNTALQIFYSPSGFAGNLPTENMAIYGPAHKPSTGINETIKALDLDPAEIDYIALIMTSQTNDAPFIGASTEAKVTQYTEVYKPDYAWVVILALSSIILSATGILGIIMGLRTTAPDVFDPVMALTYDNPYLGMPMGGSTLSAADRARLMAFMKVRLGDIRGADDVGKIALAGAGDTHLLMRGRLYE